MADENREGDFNTKKLPDIKDITEIEDIEDIEDSTEALLNEEEIKDFLNSNNILEQLENDLNHELDSEIINSQMDRDMLREQRSNRKRFFRRLKVIVLTSILIGIATGVLLYGQEEAELVSLKLVEIPLHFNSEEIIEQLTPETTILISSMGDCTLGTDLDYGMSGSFMETFNNNTPDYFFREVKSVLDEDDLSIVNLEGPLTTSTNKADKQFAFRGEMSYAQILSSGSVEAACLANNHSKDYGTQGYEDTKTALEEENLVHFGYEDAPIIDVNGIKVGLVGIYVLALGSGIKDSMIETIEDVKSRGAQVIITNFHWGVESSYYPNDVQEMLARTAIDYGADLVIGHHPHVLQGIEQYKDKYIVYSMGNFSFGGNKNPRDKDTIIFQQSFTFKGDEMTDSSINIIPCSISSVSSKNNYQPVVLSGTEAQRVGEKLMGISEADIEAFIQM